MQTSVLIIAHNEESHIRECLESLLHQSKIADEIVLIAHNCTDKTADIARGYSTVRVLEHQTIEKGPIPARAYGFSQVTGDIIACLDGDSYVTYNWLESLTKPFSNSRINSVSGFPILLGSPHTSYVWFLQGLPIIRTIFDFYFWGGNFACRRASYESVGGMDRCKNIYRDLDLHYPAEDCILSFLLQKEGHIAFARKARSYVYPGSFFAGENRGLKQWEDLKKIKKYFKK